MYVKSVPEKDWQLCTEDVDDGKDVSKGHVGDDHKQGAVDVLNTWTRRNYRTARFIEGRVADLIIVGP